MRKTVNILSRHIILKVVQNEILLALCIKERNIEILHAVF